MALSEEKVRGWIQRLLLSRMRILCSHGFYGLLLMHMVYSIDETLPTAATDGVRIIFGSDFLDRLTDDELDFVMMHEILHVVLGHCFRGRERDHERFNIACDIVVNSNILLENRMDKKSITIRGEGAAMHLAPDGKEGYAYTAEQVYGMVHVQRGKRTLTIGSGSALGRAKKELAHGKHTPSWSWDDHSCWGRYEEDDTLRHVWVKRFEDACRAMEVRDPSNTRGLLPAFARRILKDLRKPQTDWRTILNDFIQEEVVDYSFAPPDRRFEDSPFFLPELSGKADSTEQILFMIDTSASMSDDMVTAAYSEIKGAIDQFDGRLKGWLGFFDAAVIEPKPFESEEEFRVIQPAGGGGTDFQIIFEYVFQHMQDNLPSSIVILTDGYAPFPKEKLAGGIPVLWLLNNEEAEPPWGRTARITV